MNPLYIFLPLLSITLALILSSPLTLLAKKIDLLDKPNYRKLHLGRVPLIGGIMIYSAFVLSIAIFFSFNKFNQDYLCVFLGGTFLLVTGIIDDKFNINPIIKLVVQGIIAIKLCTCGFRVEYFFGLLGIGYIPTSIQYVLTLIVFLGVINAFNLIDGVDGLAGGISLICSVVFSIIALICGDVFVLLINLSLAGSILGFLRFNLSPNKKIFLGDSGSLLLGYLMVTSAILLLRQTDLFAHKNLFFSAIFSVLFIPVIDSIRVYINRIRKGKNPMKPDRTHLHHIVQVSVNNPRQTCKIIIGFTSVLIAMSFILTKVFGVTMMVLGVTLLFYIFSFLFMTNVKRKRWSRILDEINS